MEKVNLVESNLVKGECICCHRRSNKIIDGDGRCIYCENGTIILKWTQRQREFTIANVNTVIGMVIVFVIQKSTNYPVYSFVPVIIQWFVYFTLASSVLIYIYNQLKKS